MSITKKINLAKKQIQEIEKVINSIETVGIPELMRLMDEAVIATNQVDKARIGNNLNKEFDRVRILKLEVKELQRNIDSKFQPRLLHYEPE
jgi:hypothetical protein